MSAQSHEEASDGDNKKCSKSLEAVVRMCPDTRQKCGIISQYPTKLIRAECLSPGFVSFEWRRNPEERHLTSQYTLSFGYIGKGVVFTVA